MARIYWASTLKNPAPQDTNVWEPAIIPVSRANGYFLCRWSIFTLSKKHNPTGKKWAAGVAEVTPAQEAAVKAATVDIYYLTSTQIKQTFSTLSKQEQTRVTKFCQDIGITPLPAQNEVLYDLWSRISFFTDNKTLAMLEAELDRDLKAKALRAPIVPGVFLAFQAPQMSRRSLLKAAGLVGLYSIFRPSLARGVTVFTDNFTVGVDTLLDGTYPNWLNTGQSDSSYLYVNATNDRLQALARSTAYITASGIPTADQKITADLLSAGDGFGGLLTRVTTAGGLFYYVVLFDSTYNELEIYRYDDGSYVELIIDSRGVSYPAICSFQATGTGATVSLEAIGGFTSPLTADDTSGSRLTSGPPGVHFIETLGDEAWIDTVVVDDLTTPAVAVRHRSVVVK